MVGRSALRLSWYTVLEGLVILVPGFVLIKEPIQLIFRRNNGLGKLGRPYGHSLR